MKDKTIEEIEAYLNSNGIPFEFTTREENNKSFQYLKWHIGELITCMFSIDMITGISWVSIELNPAGYSDAKAITEIITRAERMCGYL